MAVGTALHYVGSGLLFIAMILTIVVDVSAPVVKDISFLNLDLPGDANAQFGVFGYCSTNSNGGDSKCSSASIGYNPANVLEGVDDADFSTAREDTTKALTRVFILHPIGTGVLLIAFLFSLLSGSTIGGIMATLTSGVAFIINAIAVIVDFVAFHLLITEIKKGSGTAKYGTAIYIALVAAILSLVSAVLMFVTCCAGRRRRRRESRKMMQY